jgi:hypothetical protein
MERMKEDIDSRKMKEDKLESTEKRYSRNKAEQLSNRLHREAKDKAFKRNMFEGQYMTQREYDTQGLDESYSNSRKKAGKNEIKELLNRLKSKDDKNQNRIFEMQNIRSLKGKHSRLILFRKRENS